MTGQQQQMNCKAFQVIYFQKLTSINLWFPFSFKLPILFISKIFVWFEGSSLANAMHSLKIVNLKTNVLFHKLTFSGQKFVGSKIFEHLIKFIG